MEESIRELRELTGLPQVKFGDMYNIPLRTLQHWEAGDRECPQYVINLLSRAVREDLERGILTGKKLI